MVISRGLSDRQRSVIETLIMKLTRTQALFYLEKEGFPMSDSTYGRIKRRLKKIQFQRLSYIAGFGFEKQHLERIDTCEYMLKLHWQNYYKEQSPYKRSLILREIRDLQPLIAAFSDATRSVMKNSIRNMT